MKKKIAALQNYIPCLSLRLREKMDAGVPFLCCSSHLPPKRNALGQSRVLVCAAMSPWHPRTSQWQSRFQESLLLLYWGCLL